MVLCKDLAFLIRFFRFSSKKSRHCLVDIPGFCLSLANCPRCTCLRMKAKGPRRLEACGWRVLLVPDSVSPPLSCFRSLSAIISITTAAATTTSTATVTLFKYAKRAFMPSYPRKSYRISSLLFLFRSYFLRSPSLIIRHNHNCPFISFVKSIKQFFLVLYQRCFDRMLTFYTSIFVDIFLRILVW